MNTGPVHALGSVHYTDPDRFALEQERVFRRTWQYAGHLSQIPGAGDYFAFELHGRSLFCLRDARGEVRTFYNVCMHRAHRLVEGSGNKRSLVCPYHAWSYSTDGRLRRAPGAERVAGFDRDAICLTGVRTEIVGGFIFVKCPAT